MVAPGFPLTPPTYSSEGAKNDLHNSKANYKAGCSRGERSEARQYVCLYVRKNW